MTSKKFFAIRFLRKPHHFTKIIISKNYCQYYYENYYVKKLLQNVTHLKKRWSISKWWSTDKSIWSAKMRNTVVGILCNEPRISYRWYAGTWQTSNHKFYQMKIGVYNFKKLLSHYSSVGEPIDLRCVFFYANFKKL
jgi:hypothetical protein